jgi:RimJ/RimL family protein N-acetyltransferase
MRRTSNGRIRAEKITPATESFALGVFSDPETRKNLIGPDLAPGNFQRWLYGSAERFVLTLDSRPVGVATLMGAPPRCFFGYALAPEFRGRGLAGPCLQAIEDLAGEAGFLTVTTNVAEDNEASVRSLRKAGYRHFRWMEKGGTAG